MNSVQIPDSLQCLFERARYKGIYGGRGGAKSHTFASALLIQASRDPLRVLCCREIQKSIKDSVKKLLDDKIQSNRQLSGFYHSTETQIRGRNGSEFIFAGLRTNIDSVKSLEGIDRVWVEEANTVSKNSLDILIPTIRKPGSELWFSWNPRYSTDPVDTMFRGKDGPPPNSIVRKVGWRQNPWFPQVLRDEMEYDKRRDLDKYHHVWEGEYLRNSESRVFRNWKVGSDEDFKPAAGTRFYYGADWGFSMDPSCIGRLWIEGRSLFIDHEAWKIGCEIDYTPFLFGGINDAELIEKNAEAYHKLRKIGLPDWPGVPGCRKWPCRADSARPETIQYMRQHGFPRMVPANKGPSSVSDGIEFIRSFDVLIHPRCTHTIDEFTHYSWKTDPLTGEVLPILEDKKNHVCDLVRYALEDARGPKSQAVPFRGF